MKPLIVPFAVTVMFGSTTVYVLYGAGSEPVLVVFMVIVVA